MRAAVLALLLVLPAAADVALQPDLMRVCSGALMMMEGMSLEQKALVLTNGHCTSGGRHNNGTYLASGETWIDRPHEDAVSVRGADGQYAGFRAARYVFATMTGADLAVIELKRSYRELLEAAPSSPIYSVSRRRASPGLKVRVPSAGMDRNHSCVVEAVIPTVKEGVWTWRDYLRFQLSESCRFIPGVSGSPVIDEAGGEIVGVAATASTGSSERCAEDNPCEIDAQGGSSARPDGTSYAVSADLLYSCWDGEARRFDPGRDGCFLKP